MGGAEGFPDLGGVIWELAPYGSTLYVGGRFHWSGSTPVTGIAAFTRPAQPDTTPPPGESSLMITWVSPNPTSGSAIVRFALPEAGPVTLSAYDLQGRLVQLLLNRDLYPGGIHDVPIRTAGWREGFYFLRLEAAGAVANRKMVVLR
jgi:hypothetical protein